MPRPVSRRMCGQPHVRVRVCGSPHTGQREGQREAQRKGQREAPSYKYRSRARIRAVAITLMTAVKTK